MEYFDQESAFEFKLISKNSVRCWHITGSSIDISITIMEDGSLLATSNNGNISKENNEKLYNAIYRAYQCWNMI